MPGPFDAARFDERSTDAVLDETAGGSLGAVILKGGFAGTLRLGRDLSIRRGLVIAGGTLAQGPHRLSLENLEQTGGRLAGGSGALQIDGAATIGGGLFETPCGTARIRILEIRAPGVVRVGENGRLELTGDGSPLLGDGLLDTTTNRPTSVEMTGRAARGLASTEQFSPPGFGGPTSSELPPFVRRHRATGPPLWRAPLAFGDPANTLALYGGEGTLTSAVVDPTNGFSYFATGFPSEASTIVKVRDSDLTRVGALTLDAGENSISAAVIDPAAGFAYFGTNTTPGRVVKIRLSDFSRVGALALGAGENGVTCAVIDTDAGFAYFGGATSPGFVAKIRLSDFALMDVLTLQPDEETRFAVIDTAAGFAYFAGEFGNVVKIRLSDFTRVGVLKVSPAGVIESALIDASAGFAYVGASLPRSVVIRVRLSDFSVVDALDLTASQIPPRAAVIDPAAGFAYFGAPDIGTIDKVRLSDFTRVSSIVLDPTEGFFSSAVIDPVAGCALFATITMPGIVVKLRLSDFTRVGALKLEMREDSPWAAALDPGGGFAYFGTYTSPGVIVKVRLSDFTRVGSLTLPDGEGPILSAVIDPAAGFALFGTDSVPAKVIKIRLSDFVREATLTLNPNEGGLYAATIDPSQGFAYFGTDPSFAAPGTPAAVIKVRASDLTRLDALAVSIGPSDVTAAAIDSGPGNAYFGVFNYATPFSGTAAVLKVSLSDFKIVGGLALDPTDRSVDASAIDPSAGFLYLGTNTNPGKVIKVRLADFSRVGDLTLGPGECCLDSALLNPATASLYLGTYSFPGRVVKIRLSDFARAGALKLGESLLAGAAMDSAAGFAYFGTDDTPGKIVRVDLSTLSEPTATVSGSLTLCAGSSAVVRAYLTGVAPWSITWTDGVIQNGVLTSPAERSVSPAATTTYTVSAVSDGNGVGAPAGQAVVTVNPLPALPQVSAPPWALTSATGLSASVPSHPGSIYAWSVENGVLTSNGALDHITFTGGTSGTTLLKVVETASGCSSPQATAAVLLVDPTTVLSFHPLPPCRVLDTREVSGPSAAAPALGANEVRHFSTSGRCSIPPTARAISTNAAVTVPASAGNLTLFAGTAFPAFTNNLSFGASQTRSNNGIVQLGVDAGRSLGVQNNSSGTVHFILDVNGYFE